MVATPLQLLSQPKIWNCQERDLQWRCIEADPSLLCLTVVAWTTCLKCVAFQPPCHSRAGMAQVMELILQLRSLRLRMLRPQLAPIRSLWRLWRARKGGMSQRLPPPTASTRPRWALALIARLIRGLKWNLSFCIFRWWACLYIVINFFDATPWQDIQCVDSSGDEAAESQEQLLHRLRRLVPYLLLTCIDIMDVFFDFKRRQVWEARLQTTIEARRLRDFGPDAVQVPTT